MLYIQWTTASATYKGSTWRLVECEHCQCPYIFLYTTQGTVYETDYYSQGSEDQQERALQKARRQLEWRLRKMVEPIPCPTCHLYQPNMCEKLREKRYGRIFLGGMIFLVPGILGLLSSVVTYFHTPYSEEMMTNSLCVGLGGMTVVTVNLALNKWVWSRYDANRRISPAIRKQIADERAFTLEEFSQQYPATLELEL